MKHLDNNLQCIKKVCGCNYDLVRLRGGVIRVMSGCDALAHVQLQCEGIQRICQFKHTIGMNKIAELLVIAV